MFRVRLQKIPRVREGRSAISKRVCSSMEGCKDPTLSSIGCGQSCFLCEMKRLDGCLRLLAVRRLHKRKTVRPPVATEPSVLFRLIESMPASEPPERCVSSPQSEVVRASSCRVASWVELRGRGFASAPAPEAVREWAGPGREVGEDHRIPCYSPCGSNGSHIHRPKTALRREIS